jgi:hypothetical protein
MFKIDFYLRNMLQSINRYKYCHTKNKTGRNRDPPHAKIVIDTNNPLYSRKDNFYKIKSTYSINMFKIGPFSQHAPTKYLLC